MKNSVFVGSLFCALVCSSASAQPFPNKPIRLIVPFVAGGSGDVVGRLIGSKLTEAWGQQIVIDNRPGAAGMIGASLAAQSAPDGYTLLLADDSVVSITPQLQKSMPFDVKRDFAPVTTIAHIEFLISVNPSVTANNLPELIELLKTNPKKFSYASAGIGSIHHLAMEWLKRRAGVEMVHVPYKGSGQILGDLTAGQVPIAYTGLAQTLPFIKAGKLKPIALGGPNANASVPGVKPVADTIKEFDGTAYWNLFAPAGTPREIITKLNAEVNRILEDPQVIAQLSSAGLKPIGGSPEQLATRMRADYEKWGKVIREIGLKLD